MEACVTRPAGQYEPVVEQSLGHASTSDVWLVRLLLPNLPAGHAVFVETSGQKWPAGHGGALVKPVVPPGQ